MAFLASPVANPALQCALAFTIHQHREAFSSVMKFLKDLVHCPRDSYVVGAQVFPPYYSHGRVLCDFPP